MAQVRAPQEHGIGRGSNIDGKWSRVLVGGNSTKVVHGTTLATLWADLWLSVHRFIGFLFGLVLLGIFAYVMVGVLLSMLFGFDISKWFTMWF